MANDLLRDINTPQRGAPPPAKDSAPNALTRNLTIILVFLGIMWAIGLLNLIPGIRLNAYGIHPRSATGLIGLVTAPFLHGGIGHLISNTIPFAILGLLTLARGRAVFTAVTVIVALLGGGAVWLVGSSFSNHIGASGLVFGYFGFNLAIGIFERSFMSLAVTVAVGLFYGSMIFGVLPTRPYVSWEGHLFGFLAGVGMAYLLGNRSRKKRLEAQGTA